MMVVVLLLMVVVVVVVVVVLVYEWLLVPAACPSPRERGSYAGRDPS